MNRKGQEEITGFVIVVVLVSVILVVVLGLMLSFSGNSESGSVELRHFLESTLQSSDECAINSLEPYSPIGDLVLECYKDSFSTCSSSSEKVCDALKETLEESIQTGWNIGEESRFKGYELSIEHFTNSSVGSEEYVLEEISGSCERGFIADEYSIPERRSRGRLVTRLKLCL